MSKPEQQYTGLDISKLIPSTIISVAAAFFAYILILLFTNYVILYFAYDFDIPASFDLVGLKLDYNTGTSGWSRDALITILLAKPSSALAAGVIFLIILIQSGKKPVSLIFLLFWLNVFALATTFNVLIDDLMIHTGTWDVAAEMNIGGVSVFIVAVIMAFLLFKTGIMNGRVIIGSFAYQNLHLIKNRIIFFLIVFFIPWGCVFWLFSYLSQVPITYSIWFKVIPPVIFLSSFISVKGYEKERINKSPVIKPSITDILFSVLFVILSIVLIFVVRNGITITGS